MSTFMVNQMSKSYDSILKSYYNMSKTAGNNSATFSQAVEKVLANKVNKAENTSAAEKTNKVSVQEMPLEEYKEYIHDKITNLYLSPAQVNYQYSIEISDGAFERMQKEPEYEKYVLDSIQTNMKFSPRIPSGGSTYIYLYYDKDISKEHGYGYSFGSEGNNPLSANGTKKSFWEKTAKEKEKAKKLLQLQHDKKWAEQEQLNQIAMKKSIQAMMRLQNNALGSLLNQGAYQNDSAMLNSDADQVYSALSDDIMSIMTRGII
jgi:hypothetical protein